MPSRALTRREFLKCLGAAGAGAASAITANYITQRRAAYNDLFHIYEDANRNNLNYDEALQFSERFDHLADTFDYRPEISQERLLDWKREALPMYGYEGAVTIIVNPKTVDFFFSDTDSRLHNHVLGYSDCETLVRLNGRMINPVSHWRDSTEFVPTIIHELAHVQQGQDICRDNSSEAVENAAQIVTWEILAALANAGNQEAAYALVLELRNVFLDIVLYRAIENNRLPEYEALMLSLADDHLAKTRYDRMLRAWDNNLEGLKDILQKYQVQPMTKVIRAINDGSFAIPYLALNNGSIFFPPSEGAAHPWPFKVDDLAYFIADAEFIIDAYNHR